MNRIAFESRTVLLAASDDARTAELSAVVRSAGFSVTRVASAQAALAALRDLTPVAAVVDYGTDLSSSQVVELLRTMTPSLPILTIIRDPLEPAIADAVRAGTSDVIEESRAPERLREVLVNLERDAATDAGRDAAERDRVEFLALHADLFRRSERMRQIESAVVRAAGADCPVLLTGETGAGKKTVARALHYLSKRANSPCVDVRCFAAPPYIFETELFGDRGVSGRLDLANGGTVVLEEITELSLTSQQLLLHLVSEGRVHPADDRYAAAIDVRVIATTTRDLGPRIATESFRKDLYDALNVITIDIPPLRERAEEIPTLAELFRSRFMERYGREVPSLPDDLLARLTAYRWPGNVLELESLMRRYVVTGRPEHLSAELRARARLSGRPDRRTGLAGDVQLTSLREIGRRAAQAAERAAILDALELAHGNRSEAARLLKVSYKTFLTKLGQSGLLGTRPGGTRRT